MDKALKIIGLSTFGIFTGIAVNAAIKAAKASNTTEKLLIDISTINIKRIEYKAVVFPKSVVYNFVLRFINPTKDDLVISSPFVVLNVKDNKGQFSRIANSAQADNNQINLAAKANTNYTLELEVDFLKVIPFVKNFVDYIIDRLRGKKASIIAQANISVDVLGVTVSDDKIIQI